MTIINKTKIIAVAVVVIAIGLGWWLWMGGSAESSSGKRYGKVKRGDLLQRVTVSGQVRPLRRTAFMAPSAGYILKIYVRVGQRVKQNDPVVSIKSSLQSPEPVWPMRAPFAGMVVDVSKMEGEYCNEKDPKDVIIRIDDTEKYFVVARAAELDASRIKKGMEVEIKVSALGATPLKGVVRDINLAAQDGDGWKSQQSTFDVRVEILNPPEALRSGQSAILDIVTSKIPNVLYLEQEFVNQEGDKHFVINRRGKHLPIEIGRQSDVAMEVKSGLTEGEEVEQIDFLKLLESGI